MKEKKKIYVVIDTNVLVSSLLSSNGLSNPATIIKCIFNEVITPLYNSSIIEEYREVLSRPKFRFPPELIENLISGLITFGVDTICSNIAIDEIFPDSDDIVFYEVAMSREDSFLITGNLKHFPKKPFVVTPTQMVEILTERGYL